MPNVLIVIHTSMSSACQEFDIRFPRTMKLHFCTLFKTCQTLSVFFVFFSVPLGAKTVFFFRDTIRKNEARVVSCGSKQYVQQFIEHEITGGGVSEAHWWEMASFQSRWFLKVPA